MYGYGHGRVYKSDDYKEWQWEAHVAWLEQRKHLAVKKVPAYYCLWVVINQKDTSRNRDLGNLEKVISDFLQMEGIVENDHLAVDIRFTMGKIVPEGQAKVTVWPYKGSGLDDDSVT